MVVHAARADQSNGESVVIALRRTPEELRRGIRVAAPKPKNRTRVKPALPRTAARPPGGAQAEGAEIASSAAPARKEAAGPARGFGAGGDRVIAFAVHQTLAVAIARSGRGVR